MSLTPGTRFGPYEILAPIGAGGMGEVYRAKDSRLGREVAIKVLPAGFSADGERLKRFELEARATSALNHPNILSIFDFGTHDGAPYLVAELLEGETLRDKLTGPLPPRKAVEWAIQMAHGLAAAHDKGIVHRDLKPENLFITKDNRLKILDFGLAKLTGPVGPQAGSDDTPTRSVGTAAGVVMGTVGYMSPEQVRGEAVDARSDIFAFGTILYEMISGKRAFKGNSAVETMNAILTVEPPELPAGEPLPPPGLERLVRHCLEKTPEARFQSARDLAFHLEALTGMSGSGAMANTAKASVRRSPSIRHWLTTLLLCVFAAITAIYFHHPTITRHPIRSSLLPPEKTNIELGNTYAGMQVISPDGRNLAFVAKLPDSKASLWIRSLDSMIAKPLNGTEGAEYPFWSPDSRFVAFFTSGKLKKIDASGGLVTTLGDTPTGMGGTWSSDNLILFIPTAFGPLYQISAAGGNATPVKRPQELLPDNQPMWPVFLPDGQHYLYILPGGRVAKSRANAVYVATLDGKANKFLLESDSNVAYASGHLLYLNGRTLVAQPFDAKRLQVTGEAIPVADSVWHGHGFNFGGFSVSQNGLLVFQEAALNQENVLQLTWIDRSGKRTSVLGDPADYGDFRVSPDGKQVAVMIWEVDKPGADLWVYDVARAVKTRLTFDPDFQKMWPVWSSDSRRIVFFSSKEYKYNLKLNVIAADGSGGATQLLESKVYLAATDWSADGRMLAYFELGAADANTPNVIPPNKNSLWVLPMEGDRKPVLILPPGTAEWNAQFSPDGKWIAYQAHPSDVFVTPYPEPGSRILVASNDCTNPSWRSDGKALIYSQKGQLMETAIKVAGNTLEVGETHPLFKLPGNAGKFSATADGQRFLLAVVPESTIATEKSTSPPSLTLVINWDAELKK